MDTQSVYADIEATLGHVPEFILAIPAEAVAGFWSQFKGFQLAESAIPLKYKELIGLAVASTIPCHYCVTFHKEAARLHGATDRELREAIAMAGITRQGSTLLNGLQQPHERFEEELREIVSYLKEQSARPGRAVHA